MSSVTSQSSAVELLGADNWHTWKPAVEAKLRSRGLWAYVQGRPRPADADDDASTTETRRVTERQQAWEDKNSQAAGLIFSSIELTRQSVITEAIKDDARACWAAVEVEYGRQTVHQLGRIRSRVTGVKYVDGASMADHIALFYETRRQLHGSVMAINDSTLAWMLLNSVPESFDSLVTALNSTSGYPADGHFTFERIRNAFLTEEQRRRTAAAETARTHQQLHAFYHGGQQGSSRTSASWPQSTATAGAQEAAQQRAACLHCGGTGHLLADCYILHPEQAPAGWTPSAARARFAAETASSQQAALISRGAESLGPRIDFNNGFALLHTTVTGRGGALPTCTGDQALEGMGESELALYQGVQAVPCAE